MKSQNLQCPICSTPKFYTETKEIHGLRYHLEDFHKRVDFMELIALTHRIARTQRINEYNSLRVQNKLH